MAEAKPAKRYQCTRCLHIANRIALVRHLARKKPCRARGSWPPDKPPEMVVVYVRDATSTGGTEATVTIDAVKDAMRSVLQSSPVQYNISATNTINNNININIVGFGKEVLSHMTADRLKRIYESTPLGEVLARVIEAIYFDPALKGKNATFIMPPPGNPCNTYAVVRDPTVPNTTQFLPATEVANTVAQRGVDVIDESINIEESTLYCTLEPSLHKKLDTHIDRLTELLNDDTAETESVLSNVSAQLSDMTRRANITISVTV